MPNIRTLKTSFVAGELAPEMFGRVDFDKYQAGLALCENFCVTPQGAVQNRAGFKYCGTVKNPAVATRLIPFSFNNSQTMAIELGAGYFRFWADEAPIVNAPSPSLLVNGLFPANLSGWSAAYAGLPTWVSSGDVSFLNAANQGIVQAITVLPGQEYEVVVKCISGTCGLKVGSTSGGTDYINASFSGYRRFVFVASGLTTAYITLFGGSGGTAMVLAGVSLRVFNFYLRGYDQTVSYAVGAYVYGVDGVTYSALVAGSGLPLTNTSDWLASVNAYTLPNSYAAADLFAIHYVQSGDVVTLVHPNYPPMELSRFNNTFWTFTAIAFASSLAAPAAPTASATYPTSGYPTNRTYLITALDNYGQEESLPSVASAVCNNDLTIAGNYNTVTWTGGASGVGYFNVYCAINGGFGFVGQVPNAAGTLTFTDKNITPAMTQTPPMTDSPMASAGNYPGAVGYYEARRIFGGTNNQPMSFWASQSGTDSNMNYSVPSQDSDALRVSIQAARSSDILHIVGEQDLILLTASDEWRVFTASGDALTPATVAIKKQQSNGSTNVVPVLVQNRLLYTTAACGHIRALIYDWQLNGYRSDDVCLLAQHLFRNHSIVDMAYSRWAPYPTLWVVRDDGVLLGLTYEPTQEVAAWHQHVSVNGAFESVCCIQEGNNDVLYAVVRRVINGVTTRYVEAMDARAYGSALSAAFFVDSGITQVFGAAVSSVSGLTWLAGQSVSALLDGKAVTGLVVSGSGSVTLPFAANTVTIGLPITATLQTMPVTVAGDASAGLGHVKNVNKVWARVVDFCGCSAGPAGGTLVSVPPLAKDGGGNPVMASGELRSVPMPLFGSDGSVAFVQGLPLPLTVCDVVLEVAIGG